MLQNGIKKCAAWTPCLSISMDIAVGENLFTAPGKRGEALSYDQFAIGVYKDENCNLLVRHLPIEISSLSYHFLKKSPENKIIVKITGKREREIGLVVPANFVYIIKDKNCSVILEAELEKRMTLFQAPSLPEQF